MTTVTATGEKSRQVAIWLTLVALLVLAMVIVGGATRLTGSGLSITQWKPLTGAIPPLSHAVWVDLFGRYQATPQYRLINRGMSLESFKFIFWWEWAHRLLGRTLGLAFAGPFLVFLLSRRIPRRLALPLLGLMLLGALQGVVGWWMVRSGLEARVSVAPERLATHLGLALLLFMALIWTALNAWRGPEVRADRLAWTLSTGTLMLAVYLQCLLGALVAGNRGGLVDGDWPLMGGALVPSDYGRGGLWVSFAHGATTAQFNHRSVGYFIAMLSFGLAVGSLLSRRIPPGMRTLAICTCALVAFQIVLGILTLWFGVPLWLALWHQINAAILLATAVAFAWRCRRA